MRRTLAKFKVEYLQILDQQGNADENLMPKLSDDRVKQFYELMVLSRVFDTKAISLQRQGRLGTYASALGQEASQVGSAITLDKNDWVVPSYRESSALIARNYPMSMLFQYWGGDERGNKIKIPPYNLPTSIPVGSQSLHAVGIALALKLQKKKQAALGYFGDGATSKGDFHEAANFAGVFKVPAVLFCQNNQYAISVPREQQTAAETIAQKAIAYGFDGIQVDGNDIFAVYQATSEALNKAKAGNGPTLIEAFTYRMSDHTTSDDAKRYRSTKELEEWKKRDPIDRLQKYMKSKGLWDEKYGKEVQEKSKQQVEKAVEDYESVPAPNPDDMFKYTYAEMPAGLKEQMEYLRQFR